MLDGIVMFNNAQALPPDVVGEPLNVNLPQTGVIRVRKWLLDVIDY